MLGETPGDARVRDGGYLQGDSGDCCGGRGATRDTGCGGRTLRVRYIVLYATVVCLTTANVYVGALKLIAFNPLQ